jgi:TrmH family RNA methyltransferase
MLVEKITSRQNPLVRRFRNVRDGSERNLVFLEGVRLVEEAILADYHFESIAFTSEVDSTERGAALNDKLRKVPCRGAHVSAQVMEAISDTESPPGVVALITRPYYDTAEVFLAAPQLLVIADQLGDPGNLGTIIRTAEAAGATGLLTIRGTVDPFNPKALRASMGSALRLPISAGVKRPDLIDLAKAHCVRLISASLPKPIAPDSSGTSQLYSDVDLTGPVAIVLGSEPAGISEEMAARGDLLVHIPMARPVESLNVAAAAAVLLYEAARQRRITSARV